MTARRKARWIDTFSAVAVALYFMWLGNHMDTFGWGQQIILLIVGYALLDSLFIQRWPRAEALRKAMRLRPGQRIEAEGREEGNLRARVEGR